MQHPQLLLSRFVMEGLSPAAMRTCSKSRLGIRSDDVLLPLCKSHKNGLATAHCPSRLCELPSSSPSQLFFLFALRAFSDPSFFTMLTIAFVLSSLSLIAVAVPHDRQTRGIRIPLQKRSNFTVDDIVDGLALNSIVSATIAYVVLCLLSDTKILMLF